jgi:hypothetical protein
LFNKKDFTEWRVGSQDSVKLYKALHSREFHSDDYARGSFIIRSFSYFLLEVVLLQPCSVFHFQKIPWPTKILAKSQSLFQNIQLKRSEKTTGCGGRW